MLPLPLMAIFNSKALDRAVHSTELPELSKEDLATLQNELIECIVSIQTSLAEVKSFEGKHNLLPDEDWQHRAQKKLRICKQFAAKIEAFENGTPPATFKDAYAARLREILLEELGPTSLQRIEDEAAELARADVERR